MMRTSQGTCPLCGKTAFVNAAHKVMAHRVPHHIYKDGRGCRGAGRVAVELRKDFPVADQETVYLDVDGIEVKIKVEGSVLTVWAYKERLTPIHPRPSWVEVDQVDVRSYM